MESHHRIIVELLIRLTKAVHRVRVFIVLIVYNLFLRMLTLQCRITKHLLEIKLVDGSCIMDGFIEIGFSISKQDGHLLGDLCKFMS